MKKIIYYSSLVAAWILAVMLLALILLIVGVLPLKFDFAYSFGSACGYPQLWVISIGIVLFVRPLIYKLVMKEDRKFKKTAAIILVVFGTVWLTINLGVKIFSEYTQEQLIEQNNPK